MPTVAAASLMFFVHVLGCVVLGVLGTRIPIPTFLLTSATTTPSTIPVKEDEMVYLNPQSTTADLSLADLQDLFKKILSSDIAHFKTTPAMKNLLKTKKRYHQILHQVGKSIQVKPARTSQPLEIKSHLFRFRLLNQMLTTPACSLTW